MPWPGRSGLTPRWGFRDDGDADHLWLDGNAYAGGGGGGSRGGATISTSVVLGGRRTRPITTQAAVPGHRTPLVVAAVQERSNPTAAAVGGSGVVKVGTRMTKYRSLKEEQWQPRELTTLTPKAGGSLPSHRRHTWNGLEQNLGGTGTPDPYTDDGDQSLLRPVPNWDPGITVDVGEVYRWDGTLVEVIQGHTGRPTGSPTWSPHCSRSTVREARRCRSPWVPAWQDRRGRLPDR